MAIEKPKKFGLGLVMLAGFLAVVVLLFLPIWGGKNVFNLTDDLYNSVSKSSSYFIPEVKEKAEAYNGQQISFTAKAKDNDMAQQMVKIFTAHGATASANEKSVKVSGDFGRIMEGALADSDAMYYNRGGEVSAEYGFNERNAMYDWWNAFDTAQKDLNNKGGSTEFDQAKMLREVNEKAVEPAYNYYNIEVKSPRSEAIPIALSLGGYILYTVWYGFALLFMFDGWGLKMEH